jgi:hypothetical protein
MINGCSGDTALRHEHEFFDDLVLSSEDFNWEVFNNVREDF